MKASLLAVFSFLFIAVYSQQPVPPTIKWQKSMGGTNIDEAREIFATKDGGCVVAAVTYSNDSDVVGNHGKRDYWLIKFNALGVIQWKKTYGGSKDDIVSSIQQTTDGGYIVAGSSASNNGNIIGHHNNTTVEQNYDYWVLKLDIAGNIVWRKCYGGYQDDYAKAVRQTADGGYIVVGYTGSINGDITVRKGWADVWIIKLGADGTLQWQKTFGGRYNDYVGDIRQTPDGGYIVVGNTWSELDSTHKHRGGYPDYWVFKIDATGSLQWQKCYGSDGPDLAYSVENTADGGYMVVGSQGRLNGDIKVPIRGSWLIRLSSTGTLQWQRSYGGINYGAVIQSIKRNADGTYILAGSAFTNNGDISGLHGIGSDAWLVKIDNAGAIIWQKPFGGTNNEYAYSVAVTNDKGYFFAGSSGGGINGDVTSHRGPKSVQDIWVVRLNAESLNDPQTISFSALPAKTLLDTDFQLTATASSGLPISYSSSDTNVVSIVSGNIAHIKRRGIVTITANQHGNAVYRAAPSVTRNDTIARFAIIGYLDGAYACTSTTFGTTIGNNVPGGVNYQWTKNGVAVGSNATYTDAALQDSDIIKCIASSGGKVDSNEVKIAVRPLLTPVITVIQNPGFPICYGTSIRFRAINIYGGGSTPVYQWMKSNIAVGTNSSEYNDNTLNDKDSVWVVVTSSYPCVTSATAVSNKIVASVSAGLPAKPSAISGPASVTASQAGINYSVSTVADVTYLWSIPADASFVTDKHNNTVTVNWGSTAGNVIAQTRNGCGYSAKRVLAVNVTPSLVNASESETSVTVTGKAALYPNPAKNFATVSFTAMEAGKYMVQVSDANGRILQVKETNAAKGRNTININVSGYAKGSYFVRLSNKDGRQQATFTLVVAR